MSSSPKAEPDNEAGRSDAEPDDPRPWVTRDVPGLGTLVFLRCSSSSVVVLEAATERWVANIAVLVTGTRTMYHNWAFRHALGENQFDLRGRAVRQLVMDTAKETLTLLPGTAPAGWCPPRRGCGGGASALRVLSHWARPAAAPSPAS